MILVSNKIQRKLVVFILGKTSQNCLSLNNCTIYGDGEFYNSIVKAFNIIANKYHDIFNLLCKQSWIITYTNRDKPSLLYLNIPIMGISKGWFLWGSEGIIAYTVYCCYLKENQDSNIYSLRSISRNKARIQTFDFLSNHLFPDDIKQSFYDNNR
jgi:hypothetical protein